MRPARLPQSGASVCVAISQHKSPRGPEGRHQTFTKRLAQAIPAGQPVEGHLPGHVLSIPTLPSNQPAFTEIREGVQIDEYRSCPDGEIASLLGLMDKV